VSHSGWLANTASIASLTCGDVEICLLGDAAVIHATTSYSRPDGSPGHGRYTDVWTNQSGRWLCVSALVGRG
jgi:ketosteroid isomerase-like protein